MDDNYSIEVACLRKRFGATQALDGMSFTVTPGQITGFVGPNGAGKSTTMRVILGLDAADRGTALIGGRPYRSLRQPLSHIGALLDAAAVQPGGRRRRDLGPGGRPVRGGQPGRQAGHRLGHHQRRIPRHPAGRLLDRPAVDPVKPTARDQPVLGGSRPAALALRLSGEGP
jgi:energy-coupling factor transporter ATP-binding protein EcfA2